jgi:uncharacterized protein YbcI
VNDSHDGGTPTLAPDDQRLSMAISNEMVAIYKKQFGRGPTRTRTHWAGPDIVIVTLEHTLTQAERKLLALGEAGRLRDLRMLFQYAATESFCEPIERLTGRKVRSFVSGVDVHSDLATEMFVLHPEGYDGPSRTAASNGADSAHGANGLPAGRNGIR